MSTVVEIIDAVKNLDEQEKGEFLEKLTEVDFDDAWDRQIEAEADAKAGRLDHLSQQEGQSRSMKSSTTPSFWRAYRSLPAEIQTEATKSYRLWKENPRHPSLR